MSRTHVYIVGAGFSQYAGLPIQAGFTEALLEPRADEEYPRRPLIDHLEKFVHDAFDHNESAKARFWPNMEDVFTNIDMAANTGHHLGSKHPPSRLRTTRGVLLARMMWMLHDATGFSYFHVHVLITNTTAKHFMARYAFVKDESVFCT